MNLYRFVFFYPFLLAFLYFIPSLVVYAINLSTWRWVLKIITLLYTFGIVYTTVILITGIKVVFGIDDTLMSRIVIIIIAVAMGVYVIKLLRTLILGVAYYEGHASIFIQTPTNSLSSYMLRLEDDPQYFKTEIEIPKHIFQTLQNGRDFSETKPLICNGTIQLWYLRTLNIALKVTETTAKSTIAVHEAGNDIST